MAKTPAGVYGLLNQIWPPALANAKREVAQLQRLIDAEQGGFKLQPWDWAYYTEKLRKAKYDLDEEALRPYFPLEQVKAGVFDVARRFYGITFREVKDMPVYHPEAKAYEVREADGRHIGVIVVDYHPRAGKRPGAWMGYFRKPWVKRGKTVAPIVFNVGNFSRPTADRPALLAPEEVRTLFHEFGHALHGLLTKCRYRSQSGTSVYRDFVELPSQIMENWAMEPAVLRTYARHWKTGAVIPDAVIKKLEATRVFNQGFKTVELTSAALLDMDWHTITEAQEPETAAFERQSLKKMGLIPQIVVRYRSTYFAHIVGGYAAGYYSYLWSAVLDADAFEAFKEKGDLFDPATAKLVPGERAGEGRQRGGRGPVPALPRAPAGGRAAAPAAGAQLRAGVASRERQARAPELLAPAGDVEKLKVALHFGADAVYLGLGASRCAASPPTSAGTSSSGRSGHAHGLGRRVYVAGQHPAL